MAKQRRRLGWLGRSALWTTVAGGLAAGLVVNLAGLSKSTAAADIAHGGC